MCKISRYQSLFLALLAMPLLGACQIFWQDNPGTPDASIDAGSRCIGDGDAGVNRDIDILFVIDNSGSMFEEQASLAANFPNFMSVLDNIQGGLPNVHIGVVSSNVGVGGYNIAGCGGDGDNGELQNVARGACTPPSGKFISDVASASGTTRVRNYEGTLADTFSCISRLGTSGCAFEQHLESMKRALEPFQTVNAGFLREHAYLAVVFIADEDDCSAGNSSVYDPNDTALTSTLGPLESFRCTEFGITCAEGNLTRNAASYTQCRPRTDSYLRNPQDYVDFLKNLKCDPSKILVAGIVGNPDPVRVTFNDMGHPQLAHSCLDPSGIGGAADPAVRLKYVLDQFPGSTMTSICNNDLSSALQKIAEQFAATIGH